MTKISVERLREIVAYDPETGVLTWRKVPENSRQRRVPKVVGAVATYLDTHGYPTIAFDSVSVLAHRAAWAMHYGAWPEKFLDHINGIPTDNRIENLREATPIQNSHNVTGRSKSKSGHRGLTLMPNGKYRVTITTFGKTRYLGEHDKETGLRLYDEAARETRGEFYREQLHTKPIAAPVLSDAQVAEFEEWFENWRRGTWDEVRGDAKRGRRECPKAWNIHGKPYMLIAWAAATQQQKEG